MGRSKFPGKPSKSVMKERIRVLHKTENAKSEKDAYCNTNKKNGGEESSCNYSGVTNTAVNCKEQPDGKSKNSTDVNSVNKPESTVEDSAKEFDKTISGKSGNNEKNDDNLEQDEEKKVPSTGTCAVICSTLNSSLCTNGNTKYSLTEVDKLTKKKTVTFKNVLETSDDTSVIKKVHNPGNKGPLVSIMKKECLSSQGYMTRGDGIVRPSRLTEILKNNENIDKTRSLSFRSAQTSKKPSDSFENKKLEHQSTSNNNQANQSQLSSIEDSSKIIFLEKEREKSEFDLRNQNENVDLQEQHSNEENYTQSLDKWNLNKLCAKSAHFDTPDESMGNEYRKRSPKRKDSTLHNKIILRQPRLHFEPQCEIVVKGKTSTINNSNNTTLLPSNSCTHSICGVCSTAVSSKNLQNRKYGIIACDACRKFISKITKKTVSSSTNPLAAFKIQCSKRDGECVISSLPKNNVKSFKKIYDERCTACWLKKCIKAFHFPSGHKLRLNAILSENHKCKVDVKNITKPFELLPSSSVNTFKYGSELISENDNTNSQSNAMNWRLITTSGGLIEPVKPHHGEFESVYNTTVPYLDSNLTFDVFSKSKQPPCDQSSINNVICMSGKHTRLFSNSILNKKSQSVLCKNIELQSTNLIVTPEYPKRQKIDFKGPRVKHVCRSASIALGQQIATFSNDDDDSKLMHSKSEIENSCFTNSLNGNIDFSGNDQENSSQNPIGDVKKVRKQFEEKVLTHGIVLNAVEAKSQLLQNPFVNDKNNHIEPTNEKKPVLFEKTFSHEKNNSQFQKSGQKFNGNKNLFMLAHRNMSSLSKRNLMRITKARNCENKPKIISIDFWDTYVPAEVNQTGFGLILSEPTPICALCFLCGSMDLDYLLFCASCCEPYHSYCIQEENNSISSMFQDKHTNEFLNQLNWVCPRCTVCYTCNMSSGAKIKCQKCKKNYHSTCIGTSKGLLGADRPLICRSCLKCQTCSTTKVLKYVGNQPICMQCFKLRKSASRCPLCNNLFDNILDLIILECGICEKLIHAKCEGLTEEQSNLLSNLPGSIKFVCKKCSLTNDNAKVLAKEWREAVYEELKAGLLDVLKLLSRSRQANVLKKTIKKNCPCVFEHINKNHHILPYENGKNQTFHTKDGLAVANDYILNNLVGSTLHSKCFCSNGLSQQAQLNNSLCLFDVKKKIINGDYVSLFDFNADMNDVIMPLKNDELILAYKEILSEKFSWFQNETKTCTDALEEDMFESCNYSFQMDEMITEDQHTTTKLPDSAGKVLNSLKHEVDNRVCLLCMKQGDGGVLQESRLLYYGYNAWVHANCAIWSNDVYEEFDGTLQNVHNIVNRGRLIKCTLCKWSGATIKCAAQTCCSYYHFQCARKSKCVFKSDKSVYCSLHYAEQKVNNSSTKETFTIFRPLYIEFDKSRRKYVEPSKVQFMIGSLSVIQLGTVYSKYSDTSEAIVPINFVCSRLYWSCREPWKIVKYNVRTLIQHSSMTFANDIGKNFTVDHSNNVNLVEWGLSQIANWHNTLTCQETLDATLHHECGQFNNLRFGTDGENHNQSISDVCVEEEPQNNSDLLPPEIKDAIFEDLPHDILDGISMLDIFPKLMIYEDIIAVEGKSDNMLTTEATENVTLQLSEDCHSLNSVNKQESNNKFPYNIINPYEEATPPTQTICPKRELHRSNSEVFLRNFETYRNQQRSSSVTWSCKFDNTRRYLTKGVSDVGLSETRVFNSNYRKVEDEHENYKSSSKENIVFEDKHLTQIKKDKFKLMQLDGTDDTIVGYLSTHVENVNSKSPVKCERCHCTYRTFDSFQRHLTSCEPISTSESETETSSRSPDVSCSTIVFQDDSIKTNLQLYQNQLLNNQKLSTNISIVSEPNIISSEQIVPQNIYVTNSAEYEDGFYVNVNKSGYNNVDNKTNSNINNGYDENSWQNVGGIGVNSFNKSISKNKRVKSNYNITNSNNRTKNEQYKVCSKTTPETIVNPETINIINNKAEYNPQSKHSYLQFLNQHLLLNNQYSQKEQQSQQQQFVVIQQSVGNNQPLFLQQVSNPATVPQNVFPVVLSNNSMQYASIPNSASPLVQGSILQTDASGNVILSSGLQMLSMPSLQLTSQSSPQLVGSYNQPQSLHLGSNQMLIGGPPTMELMPSANQVLLTAPPIYYGLETIVQNTVMSSQQFVSTAMQGVLSQNASFSATTTQVFQSSKFEPVADASSGYVILNNADGTAIVVPQTNLLSGFMNANSAHDFHNNYVQDFGNICATHPTFIQQPQQSNVLPIIPTLPDITSIPVETPINRIQAQVNLESNSHSAVPVKRNVKLASSAEYNQSSQNHNTTSDQNTMQNSQLCNLKNGSVEEIPMASSDYGTDLNVQIKDAGTDIFEMQNQSSEANKHLKTRIQVKPKATHKYIKRSRVAKNTQIGSKLVYKSIIQKEFKLNQPKETIPDNLTNKAKLVTETHNIIVDEDNLKSIPLNINQRKTSIDLQYNDLLERKGFEGRIECSESSLGLKEANPAIAPRSNNRPASKLYMMNTTKLPLTPVSFGSNFNNVPTNIVTPILQTHQSNNTPSRPTNRVLPMQSTQKPLDKSKLKCSTLKRPSLRDNLNKLLDITSTDISKKTLPIAQNIEKNNNEISVAVQKEFDLRNMVAVLKSKNEMSETKTNTVSYSSSQLNVLEKFPILDDALDLKKPDLKSNNDIPLDDLEKDTQNNVKDKSNGDFLVLNPLCDEKVDAKENKLMIESIEVYTDTQVQKPHDEPFEQNECLDLFESTGISKSNFKCKSPKQDSVEQHSLTNSSQIVLPFCSKKRAENEDIKKASEPHLIYEIQSEDGFSYKSKSIADVWEKVFEAVQCARRAHGLSSLPMGPFADMCGVQMIGLKTNALKYLIEQLPGTERCTKYTPKYHKNSSANIGSEFVHQDQEELFENIYGAVRCEPFAKRSDYDLFSWLASRHRKQPKQIFVQPSDTELIARRCTANLPMAMKYRTLKETCKHNVGVFRSLIHGRGLFCTKDIEAGEMVIEYAGELIRSTLTDKRERFYDSRGIGCYMFKIDDNFVVDATMRGNAARFINHSCEPNCYSKVVDILGHKHIIIFSLRRIVQGEELTYDYKFPFEDVKIPCSCGSKKCRKYLN